MFLAPIFSIGIYRQTVITFEVRILLDLLQHAVSHDEHVKLIPHKATKSIFRRTDDRFAANIEAGVHQDRAAGQLLKSTEQFVKQWIGIAVHGLDAGRVINMCHRRDFRTRNVELVDSEQGLFLRSHMAMLGFSDVGNNQHVRAVRRKFEPFRDVFTQYRRRERPKALAIFDLQIEVLLH